VGSLGKVTVKTRFLRRGHSYYCVTKDLKYGSIVYSAYIYLIIINIMESMSLTVAVLANGNCTACCQQEINAMFCLVKHFIIYSMKHSPA